MPLSDTQIAKDVSLAGRWLDEDKRKRGDRNG
jgi:hypothetical protein